MDTVCLNVQTGFMGAVFTLLLNHKVPDIHVEIDGARGGYFVTLVMESHVSSEVLHDLATVFDNNVTIV